MAIIVVVLTGRGERLGFGFELRRGNQGLCCCFFSPLVSVEVESQQLHTGSQVGVRDTEQRGRRPGVPSKFKSRVGDVNKESLGWKNGMRR